MADIYNTTQYKNTETEIYGNKEKTISTQTTTLQLEQAAEALYVYGFPLVITEITYWGADDKGFEHLRTFPTADEHRVVKLNMDTLYSFAWTQLAQTPYVVHIPEITERYYLFPIMDAYTNVVQSIGTRTPEHSTGEYLLLLEGAEIPEGYEDYRIIRFKDSLNSILLRIETRGEQDYPLVNQIQDSITIRPLYPEKVKPVPESEGIEPSGYVQRLSARQFFTLFARLAKDNPIREQEYVEAFQEFGFNEQTGQLDYESLDDRHKNALEIGKQRALAAMLRAERVRTESYQSNGWIVITGGLGNYGTNYLRRASTALGGWGANLVADSAYASTYTTSDGQALSRGKAYVIHFAKDEYPHAAVFWSVTLYGEPSRYPVTNPIDRYAINSHDLKNEIVQKNADGSLDIYISGERPTEENAAANWLPAPTEEEHFSLVIRIYWPDQDTLNGLWKAPEIREI